LQRPYEAKDGKLHIPDMLGIGLERDEQAIAAHLVDSFQSLSSPSRKWRPWEQGKPPRLKA